MIKHSEEFRQEAVRITLASGLPRARVASDLDVGKLTSGKRVSEYRPTDLVAAPQADLARENARITAGKVALRGAVHFHAEEALPALVAQFGKIDGQQPIF